MADDDGTVPNPGGSRVVTNPMSAEASDFSSEVEERTGTKWGLEEPTTGLQSVAATTDISTASRSINSIGALNVV
ncbi:hypothetical protein [Haloarchaeobius sp. DFWS5]|uniref:hypothetical protein n=1 Tax=Haloarchaeobius sp. DFWS5 TaxID=3446114 RepID=UPI003EB7A36B